VKHGAPIAEVATSVGIVVLGMHRTGTSVVTNILAELGCDPGSNLIDAQPDNPRGYWERRNITQIHEDFLRQCGRTWSDPRPLSARELEGRAAEDARKRLEDVLRREAFGEPLWIVKDPRMCRLMGLWKGLLDSRAFSPRFVHTVRDPAAVAGSLAARDGIPFSKSLLLWLRHTLEAERFTRGYPRVWLHLEDLEKAPAEQVRRLCDGVGLAARVDREQVDEVVTRVYSRELIHHRTGPDQAQAGVEVHPWVIRTYQQLRLLGGISEKSARLELDRIRDELESADRLFFGDPAEWERELHQERYHRLLKELQQYGTLVTTQREEVEVARREVEVARREITEPLTRIEQRHVALLGGSIELAARIEERWRELSSELEKARAERDRLASELERADRERALAVTEQRRLQGVTKEAEAQRLASEAATAAAAAELEQVRHQLATELEEKERVIAERHRIIRTRTWRYTAPLRSLWGALRGRGDGQGSE